jgi:glycosyltransferase involved in cell wall biosynthesis
MRVGVDVRKLGDGGIGEYIRETLIAERALRPDLDIVAFGSADARGLLPVAGVEWVTSRARKYSFAEHVSLPLSMRGRRLDLFHSPHYVVPLALTVPFVVTIHDLIHVLVPRSPIHRLYARLMIGSACRRARRVITVSETTARDLARYFALPAERVRVVPNGVAPRFRRLPRETVDAVLVARQIEPPYVLFVGNCLPHKNVETLVRAWAALPGKRPSLVLCGKGFDRSAAVAREIETARRSGEIAIIDEIGGEELVALYNGAEILASTSLYEGFCLPVVEAFACGTPVLAPDSGAVPEIAGDAAVLVSPRRVDTVAAEMYRLLNDLELRKGLVVRGRQRAARFSWTRAAESTLSVYEEAIEAPAHGSSRARPTGAI